ncbi:extracellular solute-binding protein [Streptosporangium sp. NPDC023825]|uniref:ABC transporter substrate-binding protein n=1 Tax=Streptosporangium sp. NPDC023825 TaxID=3154909 RepID=UPI003429357B
MIHTRRALYYAAAAALTLTLSACSLVGAGGEEASSGSKITVTVALVPDPPGASEFYRQQFDTFQAANPDINVKVVENPSDQQLSAIELMFQQGSSPDVFRAQDNGMDRMLERGWVAPLDRYVTPEFLGRFPQGSMEPATSGLHRDGKLMSLPLVWGNWSPLRVFIYNKAILKENGFDGPPKNWSEMEKMATAITKKGDGKVFGYAPTAAKALAVEMLANTAVPYSVPAQGIDFRTGEAATADPGMVEAVELHRRMQADKVMMPGWESWDGNRAFTEFAAEKLAMYPSAPWNVAEIRKLNPEIEMGVSAIPVPDSGRGAYTALPQSFGPLWGMSAQSKHPKESWKVMDFLSSLEFHKAYYTKFGTFTALESAWKDEAVKNPDQKAILDVATETLRLAPNPKLASEGGKMILTAREGKPELRHIDAAADSIVNNKPFLPMAKDIDKKLGTLIDETIAASGGKASRKDITFPGWNPLEPFEPEQ